jgi:hypothetical protein
MNQRWRNVRRVFGLVQETISPAEREAYSNAACDADVELSKDLDDAVGEFLLSLPDDAGARTPPADEADWDLARFKHSLGSAPPVRFNSEGGLSEPWTDGMHSYSEPPIEMGFCEPWADDLDLCVELPGRDFSTRARSSIETDWESAARRPRRVEARRPIEAPPPAVRRRRRVQALTATLVLFAYAVAAFWWSKTDWQRQIESPAPPQTGSCMDEPDPSTLAVLSAGVLRGADKLTIAELAILEGFVLVVPIISFGGAVAALLVRGVRHPVLHRRLRGPLFAAVTPRRRQPGPRRPRKLAETTVRPRRQ